MVKMQQPSLFLVKAGQAAGVFEQGAISECSELWSLLFQAELSNTLLTNLSLLHLFPIGWKEERTKDGDT